MSFAILALITGAILIGMALVWTLVERLPLSPGSCIWHSATRSAGGLGRHLARSDPYSSN
jgi:hypothetical protein